MAPWLREVMHGSVEHVERGDVRVGKVVTHGDHEVDVAVSVEVSEGE
jgi:hypothetical protein